MSVTTCDRTVKFGLSLLQHGHFNDRVYLMRLSEADYPAIIAEAEALVHANDYTKIIAKVPDWAKAGFEDAGYVIEATVPGFFSGRGDVYFMSKFLGSHRAAVTDRTRIDDVVIPRPADAASHGAARAPRRFYCCRPDAGQCLAPGGAVPEGL